MKGLFFSLLLYDAPDALCSLGWMILCFGHYHRRLPAAGFFFRKGGKSFAIDFIRRYKKKKREQIQLPIYNRRPLLIKTETSKTAEKTTARKKIGKKTETRDTPKTRTLAQLEKRSTASSPYYELEPSPKKTNLYHLCTNLRLVLGSNFFLLESSSIPLFPDIPPKIYYDPVKAPSLIFVNFSPTSSPVIMKRSSCVYGAEIS